MYNKEIDESKKEDKKKEISDFSKYLMSKGIDKLEIVELRGESSDKRNKYYDYSADDMNFIRKLSEIVNKDDNRIFLIDLALNDKERGMFSGSESRFVPRTAKKYLEVISEKSVKGKELIIFDTRVQNILQNWRRKLMIDSKAKEKLKVGSISINSFDPTTPTKIRNANIFDAFEYVMEDKDE